MWLAQADGADAEVMTDRRWVRLVFVAVLACALPIQAASQSRARFELFNECRPFDLFVEGLSSSLHYSRRSRFDRQRA
jgi:hypothetical protein